MDANANPLLVHPTITREQITGTIVPSTAATKSLARTHLHLGHFAFMRSLVQGIDVRQAWDRYLRLEGNYRDARTVSRTLTWLRLACASAAKREHRPGTARLITLNAALLAAEAKPVTLPTLDQFVGEHGLEDLSEREQLERYQEHYGAARVRPSKRARLVVRQLQALQWLETLVAQPPRAGDAVSAWLQPELASHLQQADINTLGELVARINGIGLHWWRSIRAVGSIKATRLVDWLMLHQASIGVPIGSHVTTTRANLESWQLQRVVKRDTAIVPLDKLIVPAQLDGRSGAYRVPQHLCLMRAQNDFEAVLIWLNSKQALSPDKIAAMKRQRGVDPLAPEGALDWLQYVSHTQRAYLREAERFMLWAIIQRQKPLSSMTLEDCQAYAAFLASPLPEKRWCGPRGREKWSPLWRPFEGPLSSRAQAQAITILKNLYSFLVDQNYLTGNPWKGVARPNKRAGRRAGVDRGRSFTQEQWQFVESRLVSLEASSANRRLAFALHLFYGTGIRLSEALSATVDQLQWVSYPDPEEGGTVEGWQLTVYGKGAKVREVPVSFEVISELSHYLGARGLDPDPQAASNVGVYLIGKAVDVAVRAPWTPAHVRDVNARNGISASTLHAQIKKFFTECGEVLAATDWLSAARFQEASTHWLRHTHGMHAVAAGMPLDIVQQNMGHDSLDTTTIYVTSPERRQMKAMAKFWEREAAQERSAPGVVSPEALTEFRAKT